MQRPLATGWLRAAKSRHAARTFQGGVVHQSREIGDRAAGWSAVPRTRRVTDRSLGRCETNRDSFDRTSAGRESRRGRNFAGRRSHRSNSAPHGGRRADSNLWLHPGRRWALVSVAESRRFPAQGRNRRWRGRSRHSRRKSWVRPRTRSGSSTRRHRCRIPSVRVYECCRVGSSRRVLPSLAWALVHSPPIPGRTFAAACRSATRAGTCPATGARRTPAAPDPRTADRSHPLPTGQRTDSTRCPAHPLEGRAAGRRPLSPRERALEFALQSAPAERWHCTVASCGKSRRICWSRGESSMPWRGSMPVYWTDCIRVEIGIGSPILTGTPLAWRRQTTADPLREGADGRQLNAHTWGRLLFGG